MSQGVLKIHDVNPDGIRIVLKWDTFVTGSSMFVPCVNTHECVRQLKSIAKNKQLCVVTKIVVENKRLGVRIWRTV